MTANLILALLLVLSGCTAIDMSRPPPADFPKLTITERYVLQDQLPDICKKAAPLFMVAKACAVFYFKSKRCEIWYSEDNLPSHDVIEEERAHCAGYDHVGSSALHEMWENWKRNR